MIMSETAHGPLARLYGIRPSPVYVRNSDALLSPRTSVKYTLVSGLDPEELVP
jgi:hypothetical protein